MVVLKMHSHEGDLIGEVSIASEHAAVLANGSVLVGQDDTYIINSVYVPLFKSKNSGDPIISVTVASMEEALKDLKEASIDTEAMEWTKGMVDKVRKEIK